MISTFLTLDIKVCKVPAISIMLDDRPGPGLPGQHFPGSLLCDLALAQ